MSVDDGIPCTACRYASRAADVRIGPGVRIGVDPEADRDRFTVSDGGVVVLGKGTVVEP